MTGEDIQCLTGNIKFGGALVVFVSSIDIFQSAVLSLTHLHSVSVQLLVVHRALAGFRFTVVLSVSSLYQIAVFQLML